MDRAVTEADIESLCGRPGAFTRVAVGLLRAHDELRKAQWLDARSCGALWRDTPSHTVWWVWPWTPDRGPERDRLREPWSCPDTRELQQLQQLHRWMASLGRTPTLRIVVPRVPADTGAWMQQLDTWLRAATPRAEPRVLIDGPAELSRCAELPGHVAELGPLRPRWTLDARALELSPCERELIAALDRGEPAREQWIIVADELQQRGDPIGESLALALAAEPERPSRERELSRAYLDHEAKRMARAPRHLRMLAFVNAGGSSHATHEFSRADAAAEPEDFTVQLWAERVGPLFVRLLVRTDDPQWQGLGLPSEVFEAPELRYLSAARLSVIDDEPSCVCGRDLSGFVLSSLTAAASPVLAYEASLRGCDLRGADLSNWQLDGADLRDAVADLRTNFGEASFVGARVSPDLQRLLTSWNAGRHRPQRGRSRGTADVRGLIVD